LVLDAGESGAGLQIHERMFRVARHIPLLVVSPKPWFPGQPLLRRFRPGYRPPAEKREEEQGHEVLFPRFLSVPGAFRRWNGWLMAAAVLRLARRLRREPGLGVIDAHFAFR
jgi:hypothetical protein